MKIKLLSLTLGVILLAGQQSLHSATAISNGGTEQKIVLENLSVQGEAVSGQVRNKSRNTMRDVELLVRHIWHWNNEYRPGKDDPSVAVYYKVDKEISPGATASLNYKPSSALPTRSDGYFETTVSVAGFTELIPSQ